ncbi:MAG: oligopeptide/dipeptide ABC transporter ATP-binding protein [Bilophila wadsworthia]
MPSPIDLKPGCRFNTRCPFAEDVCRHEEPELRKIGDNHFVACHLVRDGLGPHQRGGGVEGLTAARAGIRIARKRGIPSLKGFVMEKKRLTVHGNEVTDGRFAWVTPRRTSSCSGRAFRPGSSRWPTVTSLTAACWRGLRASCFLKG